MSSLSSSSSFPPVVPHHCSPVPMLFELLRSEEEPCRVWLRAEMNKIADPLIDSLYHGLICSSSSSSAVPQHRSTESELCQQLKGEKVQVRKVLRCEMDRLTDSLFERLSNKLRTNMDLDWVKLEINEEDEEEETQVNDIGGVAEDIESGANDDDESRSDALMNTTHSSGQAQTNDKQSGRITKRKQTEHEEPQVQNELNDREDVMQNDAGEGTSRSVKRPRPSLPTKKTYQIITHTLKCPQVECGQQIANDNFNKHLMERHSIGPFRCPVKDCRQSFVNTKNRSQHLGQRHQSTTEWHCDHCAKHFTTYSYLNIHNNHYHQYGQFQCSFPSCTFTGEHKRKVYSHYTLQHKNTFACQYADCPFTAPSASQLKQHQLGHLGIRPYRCKWLNCEYAGAQRATTIKHIRRQHLKAQSSISNSGQLCDPKDFVEVAGELLL